MFLLFDPCDAIGSMLGLFLNVSFGMRCRLGVRTDSTGRARLVSEEDIRWVKLIKLETSLMAITRSFG